MDVMWVLWDPDYDHGCITRYYPLDRPTSEEMEMLEGIKMEVEMVMKRMEVLNDAD